MTAPASSITASIGWIVDLLLGAFGVLIAVFAVAILGFGLLLGRLSAKNALRTFLGSFILFGAPAPTNSFYIVPLNGLSLIIFAK